MVKCKYLDYRFVIILLLVSLLFGSLGWAKTIKGDNSNLMFNVDYSTVRTNLTGNNSIFVYSVRTGTQPQLIVGNSAALDLMPTNKPLTITDSGNLFNFNELTTEIVWAALSLVLNNSYGTVDFERIIDVSRRSSIDLDTFVNISSNYITVNGTALSEFNKSMIVTLKDLSFSNVRVLKNGEDCLDCTLLSYSGGDVRFNIADLPGFAIYQAADGSVNPAIRIATNVVVINASMNVTGDTYNGVYPSNVTIDVGGGGAEFSQSGRFNYSSLLTNFTSALNSILPECTCSGCVLSNSDLTCTIELNISSDSAGVIELSELNISQIINNASWNEDNSYTLIDLDDYFYDADRDSLSYSYSPVENVTVSITNGIVTFTPDANFFGNRSIVFNASDGTNVTVSNNVSFTVNSVNDAPIFTGTIANQYWSENNDRIDAFDLDDYFSDVEGITLTYSANNTSGGNVTITIDGNNSVSFYPAANWTGKEIVYFIASDGVQNTSSNAVTLNVSQALPVSAPSGDTGGDAGGEAGEVSIRRKVVKEFNMSFGELKIKLATGEKGKEKLIIVNTGNTKMEFIVKIKSVDGFVFISDKVFSLFPGDSKILNIDVMTGLKYGIYSGEIVIIASGVEKSIPVVLEVVSKKILFDAKIDMPIEYKEIFPGDDLKAQVTLFNIMGGTADVLINYLIKDMNGYVLHEESETFAVEDQVSYVKEFDTDENWITGNYLVAIEMRYGNSYAVSSEMFRLKERERLAPETVRGRMVSVMFLVVSFGVFLIAFVILAKKTGKKKKR